MRPLTMRYLWSNSFWWIGCLLVLCNCTPKASSLQSTEISVPSQNLRIITAEQPIRKFKADINIYGKKFSGLLFLKYQTDTSTTAIFTTLQGAKLLALTVSPSKDSIEFAISALDNSKVLQTIATDIKLITMNIDLENAQKPMEEAKTKLLVLGYNDEKDVLRYYYTQNFNQLLKIETQTYKLNIKNRFNFTYNQQEQLQSILIQHFNFKLKIDLYTF